MGADTVDCPVSGGCHRAATGNISIFVGCDRGTFERVRRPALTTMGRHVLHTGGVGSASVLKVVTNYLATANLVSLCEALVTSKQAGMDLNIAYEAIRISSGNSFVHETESQVILNGSRNINFTMDLVRKDLSIFAAVAQRSGMPLELAPGFPAERNWPTPLGCYGMLGCVCCSATARHMADCSAARFTAPARMMCRDGARMMCRDGRI